VTHNHLKTPQFLHFELPYALRNYWLSQTSNLMYMLNVQVTTCGHITGTAEPKVVKFCTQAGYINSSNRMAYYPEKGRGYDYVTVLRFLPFAVMQCVERVRQRQLN